MTHRIQALGARRSRPVVGIATLAAGPFEPAEAELRVPGVLDTAVG